MAKLCIVCRRKEATVPDREQMGRPIKRVCKECHIKRLQGDLEYILKLRQKEKNAQMHRTNTEIEY